IGEEERPPPTITQRLIDHQTLLIQGPRGHRVTRAQGGIGQKMKRERFPPSITCRSQQAQTLVIEKEGYPEIPFAHHRRSQKGQRVGLSCPVANLAIDRHTFLETGGRRGKVTLHESQRSFSE